MRARLDNGGPWRFPDLEDTMSTVRKWYRCFVAAAVLAGAAELGRAAAAEEEEEIPCSPFDLDCGMPKVGDWQSTGPTSGYCWNVSCPIFSPSCCIVEIKK